MRESRISAERVLVYEEKLHSLLSSIEAAKEDFVGSKWAKALKASNHFIPACKNLGYVAIHYKNRKHPVYAVKLAPATVEPIHGRNVYEEISRIVSEKTRKRKACKEGNQQPVEHISNGAISTLSDSELVGELRRRGYTGKLVRSETLEI